MLLSSIYKNFILLLALSACKAEVLAQVQTSRELNLQLTTTEKADLEDYFRIMLTQSEGGYVLFGAKPVCGEAAYVAFPCSSFNIFQQRQAARLDCIDRGYETFRSLEIDSSNAPLCIIKYDHANHFAPDYKEILWLHKGAFSDAVNKSLALFQLILGPTVSAEGLLNQIQSPSGGFVETLANHKVLIGISLGFGTHNSLFASRLEYIDEIMYQPETLPLSPRHLRSGLVSPLRQMGVNAFRFTSLAQKNYEITPSAGYRSLAEEAIALRTRLSSTTLINGKLNPSIPTFAIDPQHPESVELLARYVQVQKKIQRLIESPAFLEEVLSLVTGKRVYITTSDKGKTVTSSYLEDSERALSVVTASVRKNLLEKDADYISSAIMGIRAADKEMMAGIKSKEQTAPIVAYIQAKALVDASVNLAGSERALSDVLQGALWVELIPQKVFYKTIEQGHGSRLTASHTCAVFSYTMTPIIPLKEDTITTSVNTVELSLKDLIPGLALALRGIRTDEVREIYIHPDYAYGVHANFTPGIALKVIVKLVSLPDDVSLPVEPLSYSAVDDCRKSLIGIPTTDQMGELRRAAASAEGYNAWLYYGKLGRQILSVDRFVDSLSLQKLNVEEADQSDKQLLKDIQSRILRELFPPDEFR